MATTPVPTTPMSIAGPKAFSLILLVQKLTVATATMVLPCPLESSARVRFQRLLTIVLCLPWAAAGLHRPV